MHDYLKFGTLLAVGLCFCHFFLLVLNATYFHNDYSNNNHRYEHYLIIIYQSIEYKLFCLCTTKVFDVEARNPGVFSSLSATLNDATAKLNANPNALGSVAPLLRTLKVFQEPDLFFFGEILVVREIINQVKVHRHLAVDKYPDFFHFRFLSLSRIVEKYGASSEQFAEAQTVLSAFVKEASKVILHNMVNYSFVILSSFM